MAITTDNLHGLPKYTRHSPEVFYRTGDLKIIDNRDIEFLKSAASKTPRKRARLCLHNNIDDPVHEMLIIHHHEAYVRPHRHKKKEESLQILEGAAQALFFDPAGNIKNVLDMSCRGTSGSNLPYFYRISPMTMHSLLIKSEWLVFHEVVAGPFDPDDADFPEWAPDGSNVIESLAWLGNHAREGSP